MSATMDIPSSQVPSPASSSSSPSSSVAFVITGASRGLGRAIAIVANRYYAATSHCLHFVLVARSMSGLLSTKEAILAEVSSSSSSAREDEGEERVSVVCHAVDLSNLDDLDTNLDVILNDLDVGRYRRITFINNAGSLGHLGPCITSPSLREMRDAIDLNVTSCLWSTVRFARHVHESKVDATIVNITSIVAISDEFVTAGIYSAGKAARNKYHTLLAAESEKAARQVHASSNDDSAGCSKPQLKTLNYAPGPLETDMAESIRAAPEFDVDLSVNFQKKLLDPNDSALKLILLLDENKFQSGAHIDYYDLPPLDEEDKDSTSNDT